MDDAELINVVAGLLAYSYQEKRPSLNISRCASSLVLSDPYPELRLGVVKQNKAVIF